MGFVTVTNTCVLVLYIWHWLWDCIYYMGFVTVTRT